MKATTPDLTDRLAASVSQIRRAQGLSLDALARQSGVSRSMISLIERGESSPTAVVLEKLAAAFGITLAYLFDQAAGVPAKANNPVSRRAERTVWQDPASGYVRSNISPAGGPQPMQIVEVHFPPKQRVSFETAARDVRIFQQVWVLKGAIDITLGDERHRLREGDCLAMELDRPTTIHNPTRTAARYAVVVASQPLARR